MHHPPIGHRARRHKLTNAQRGPDNCIVLFLGGAAVDALVFEFIGLAMVGLCIVVLAVPVPSERRSSRRLRDF
jgi:hypothetical protein